MDSSLCNDHMGSGSGATTRSRSLGAGRTTRSAANSALETTSDDESVFIKHRFSTTRVIKFVKTLSEPQKGFIRKYNLDFVFSLQKLTVPVHFLEWLMYHTSAVSNEFVYKDKRIQFSRDMVIKAFGIPSGNATVEVNSPDFEVDFEVEELKAEYRDGRLYPINKCMDLMRNELDEVKFIRSFMLFIISTILIPGKNNDIQVEYLYSLRDISKLGQYDWADRILYVIMGEVHRFHGLRDSYGRIVAKKHFYMDGCLPLLAIVYSDFLDLPKGGPHVHSLDYSVPRICHFTTADIKFVMDNDKNNNSSSHFGVRPFRDISCTPYSPFASIHGFHKDIHALVYKHSEQWDQELEFYAKSMKEALATRFMTFAKEMNNLYKAKIVELTGVGPSSRPCGVYVAGTSAMDRDQSIGNIAQSSGLDGAAATIGTSSAVHSALQNSIQSNPIDAVHIVPDAGLNITSEVQCHFSAQALVESLGEGQGHSSVSPQGHFSAQALVQSLGQGQGHSSVSPQGQVESFAASLKTPEVQCDISAGNKSNAVQHDPSPVHNEVDSQVVGLASDNTPGDGKVFENISPMFSSAVSVRNAADVDDVDTKVPDIAELDSSIFKINSDVESGPGLGIAMSYDTESPLNKGGDIAIPMDSKSLGASTIELKNRKKRCAAVFDDVECPPLELVLDANVDEFYKAKVLRKIDKPRHSPQMMTFVRIRGFDLSYDDFRDSLKPRGDLSDKVQSVYAHVFNAGAEKYMFDKVHELLCI